jgi:uracil-DNA glycosylase
MKDRAWQDFLKPVIEKPSVKKLLESVEKKYSSNIVFPPREELFRAFDLTSFSDVKVVIVGQDPYHGEGQANGLAFSVHPGVKIPPSLRNILKEVHMEFGQAAHVDGGDLTSWARQGVLLLNAIMSVEEGRPGAHAPFGWEEFTDDVIHKLSQEKSGLVFILWGSYARKKSALIDTSKHHILESAHPSPLSARHGFFGNNHFKNANEFLQANGKTAIDW